MRLLSLYMCASLAREPARLVFVSTLSGLISNNVKERNKDSELAAGAAETA